MKEALLQKRIIQQLRAQGHYVFKVVGSPMQQRGTPDLIICAKGLFIAVEVKLCGNMPTAIQEHEMEKIRRAEGIAEVVHTLKEMERLV